MEKIEFETFASANAIESVVAFEVAEGEGYQLWTYPRAHYVGFNTFKTAKGETRIWASLDTLVRFVRGMGYSDQIKVDSRRPAGL